MQQRITANTLHAMIKHLNTLESHVHPDDSKRYKNGSIWSIDYYPNLGVWIRRGHENPASTEHRMSVHDTWVFLSAIQYSLEYAYRKMSGQV